MNDKNRADDRWNDDQGNQDQVENRGNGKSPLGQVTIHPRDLTILPMIIEMPVCASSRKI